MDTSIPAAEPHSSLKALLAAVPDDHPGLNWTVSDLNRLSIEGFIASRDGDARSEISRGELRLHGPVVEDHAADLADVSRIGLAWQRAVDSVAASLEGWKGVRGKVPEGIASRSRLQLTASPAPGSLVLELAAKASPTIEVDDATGTRPLVDPQRPLADRATERLIVLCHSLAHGEPSDDEPNAAELESLGPRAASAVRSLADAVATSHIDLDASWREPGTPEVRAAWTSGEARRVREFVKGRALDAEIEVVTGIVHTVSDVQAWVVTIEGVDERIETRGLPLSASKNVRTRDEVTLRVATALRERPDGTTGISRRAVELISVVPIEDPPDGDE